MYVQSFMRNRRKRNFKFKGFGSTFVLLRQQEFQQYRQDIDLLIEEKNDLGQSFLSQQSDRLSDSMSEKSSHVVIFNEICS